MNKFEKIFYEAQEATMSFLVSEYSFEKFDLKVEGFNSQHFYGMVIYRTIIPWYQSQKNQKFVTLSIAPFRLEVNLDIGKGRDILDSYSIYELYNLECESVFPTRNYDLYKAIEDSETLTIIFKEFVETFKKCGQRFLNSDDSLWIELNRQRTNQRIEELDSIKSKDAAKAFQEKDWGKVINLIGSKKCELSKLEFKRLEYAKKCLKNGS